MRLEELRARLVEERTELEETALGRQLTPTELARLENLKARVAQLDDGDLDPQPEDNVS